MSESRLLFLRYLIFLTTSLRDRDSDLLVLMLISLWSIKVDVTSLSEYFLVTGYVLKNVSSMPARLH